MKTPSLLCGVLFVLLAPVLPAQDTLGTIRATTRLRPDGTTATTVMDPEKRTAEETISDGKGKVLRKTTYLLGDRDATIGAIFSDAKGTVKYQAAYQRDAAGNIVESSFTGPEGQYLGKRVFIVGPGNKVTRVEDYDAKGQLLTPPPVAGASGAKKKTR